MIHLKDLKQKRKVKKMIVFGKPFNNKEIKRRLSNFFNDTKIFLYGVAILFMVYVFFNLI